MSDNYTIYLRGFREQDYEQINRWRNDRNIQSLLSCPFRYVPEAIEREWVKSKSLNNRTDIYLAVCLKADDRMIGYVSVNDIDYQQRVAYGGGIVLDSEFHDGIVRYEVGMLVRELVFDQLNINRYEGRCLAEHKASRIVMEATGYKLEGVLRQAVYKDGRYHDQCVYSLLRDDYYDWMSCDAYSLKSFAGKVRELNKRYK